MNSVIVSDIHLGKYKYGKVNHKTGYDLRTEDILKNFDESIDFAIKKKADCFIITGDLYHTKRPLEIFRRFLASRFNRILENNIEVFVLLGNHDQGKTSGHDLVELLEVSNQIKNFHIIDRPTSFDLENSLFCFLPCTNKIDFNIQESEYEYNIKEIRKFSKIASESNKKFKFFFGHFGTDHSMAGKNFDLGTIETGSNKARVIPIKEFEKSLWTKVYLGDIHKPQEMNDFCRHIGSIARVDFGEEDEQKGFYYFENEKDQLIKVRDREFKTLEVDLIDKAREQMGKFCEDVQDLDLSEAIVRLKIKIKTDDRKLINFDALESYLKDSSWNYIGKSIIEFDDKIQTISIGSNEDLNHVLLFENYLKSIEKQIDKDVYEDLNIEGKKILSDILNS